MSSRSLAHSDGGWTSGHPECPHTHVGAGLERGAVREKINESASVFFRDWIRSPCTAYTKSNLVLMAARLVTLDYSPNDVESRVESRVSWVSAIGTSTAGASSYAKATEDEMNPLVYPVRRAGTKTAGSYEGLTGRQKNTVVFLRETHFPLAPH